MKRNHNLHEESSAYGPARLPLLDVFRTFKEKEFFNNSSFA